MIAYSSCFSRESGRLIRETPLKAKTENNIFNVLWICLGCNDDLGMENSKITDASINASSYLGEGYVPWNARYNRHHGKGAWCARDNVPDEFIQVQLRRVHIISQIAVQGKLKTSPAEPMGKAWVTKFVVDYSENGLTWSEYSDGSGVKVNS